MASPAAQDPYYVVKDEVSSKVEYIKVRLDRFRDLLQSTNTAADKEFQQLRGSLAREIKAAEAQLKDLKRTVEHVDSNRKLFPHIDDRELNERKNFVKTAKKQLASARHEMEGERAVSKMRADETKASEKSTRSGTEPVAGGGASSVEMTNPNQNLIEGHQSQVQQQLARQDQDLEELGQHIDRVGEMGTVIHDELVDQHRMLQALDEDLDEAAEKMNFVMGHLAKLLKTKDRCQIWTIVVLVVVLIVLVFCTIYF